MCSGDGESLCSCGIVTVGECVCSGDSECLWTGWSINTVMVCVMCNGNDGRTIENEWTYLVQSLPEGEDWGELSSQGFRIKLPSTSPILVTTSSWEMT